MTRRVLSGAAIFDGARLHEGKALVVENERVVALVPEASAPEGERVDLPGGIVAPGLLDLQVNGGGGIMLGEMPSVDGIRRICRAHSALGSTGVMPTLITDRPEITRAVLAAGREAAEAGVEGFLGLHLEGPHLDQRRKGAHDPSLIRPMEDADLSLLVAAARDLPALLVTLAPEAVGLRQIEALAQAGIIVSLGHTDCGFAVARDAFNAGARAVTHLFNAMSPLGHREPGLVGAALDSGAVAAGIIADGVHVRPEVLRIAFAAKRAASDTVFLVTDAMAVAGTTRDRFGLGGREVLRRDGRLALADGTLAGADCTLPACIGLLHDRCDLPVEAALRLATRNPAALLGIERGRGVLSAGARADLVLLDEAFRCARVWREGRPEEEATAAR